MSLNIKLDNFEGPFDLLLHLIKKNKMDIYDIKIYDITSQYLDYIKTMKQMDLEITSEFIVIAANLLEIKSKMLLPKNKTEDLEKDEKDPRLELVSKLVEYKKYKLLANFFREREENVGVVFTKKPEIIDDSRENTTSTEELLKGITMLELFNLYDRLLNTYLDKTNTENGISKEIPIDKFRIEDKMNELLSMFGSKDKMYFSNIKEQCNSKIEVVVTFLALLELIKLRDIKVIQQSNFREIYMERILDSGKI
ncbi:segregation/condensation protein A [Clostridium arbusti]|jgi:segregation and condensation protein A|uniref:segregation/condensation protein A n=1 Tax=Clostridium arbusti TaxID=1137848 RepID=UPI000288C457|nr:segregation/condensation protein A [Clostridium arbusti]